MSPTGFSNFSNVNPAIANIASSGFGTSFTLSPAILAALASNFNVGAVAGGATVGPAATATNPGTVPSAGTPLLMRVMLNAIPIAQEGHIITSEYHNSLRDALILLAEMVGASPNLGDLNLNFAPALLAITEAGAQAAAWEVRPGVASRGQAASAQGWMPVQLPNGWNINTMRVTGRRSGTVTTCQVVLARQKLTEPEREVLITVQLRDIQGDPFTSPATEVKGPSTAVVQNLSLVDTDQYHYFIHATLTGAADGAEVDLHSIQIACRQF